MSGAPPPAPGADPPRDFARDPSRFKGFGDLLFAWRGELAVPFLFGSLYFGAPVAWSFIAGLALSALGELVRLSALRHIGPKSRRTRRTGSHEIVRTGPYAWTRNPLYLGNWIMMMGVLVALNRPLLLAAGAVIVPLYYRAIIRAEERALEAEFGDSYRRYLAEVPRLFPRPPGGPSAPAPYGFAEIIVPEMNTIVSFELAFAIAGALAIWRASR